MSTKIFSANIIIGSDSNQYIIEKIAVKRLPVEVLIADTVFVKRIESHVPKDVWAKLPRIKDNLLPSIKIFYLKYLGEIGEEPSLTI